MLDPRRPPSIPPSDAQGGILTEVVLVGGTVAALYFAAYLYEIGFLWRLGLPVSLAEIGFSRSLAIVAIAAPAGCCLIGSVLRLRAVAAGGPAFDRSGPQPVMALAAITVIVTVLIFDAPRGYFLDSALIEYGNGGFGMLRGLVFLGGIVAIGYFQDYAGGMFSRAEPGRIALASLLLLLTWLLAVGLGWRGAGLKESRPQTFLYLSGSDLALVRLYPDKAVFLQYDRAGGKFGSNYRVRHFADAEEAELARTLEMRRE